MALVDYSVRTASERFVMVPDRLWMDSAISRATKLTYLAVRHHINGSGIAWPSLDRIAAVAGVSRASVKRALPTLEAGGWLVITRQHNRANRYRLGEGFPRLRLVTNEPSKVHHEPSGGLTMTPELDQELYPITIRANQKLETTEADLAVGRMEPSMEQEPDWSEYSKLFDEAEPHSAKQPTLDTRKPRKVDEIWDCLVELFGQPATKDERGRLNRAAKQFRDGAVTPDRIKAAASTFRRRYPEMSFTAETLVGRIGELERWAAEQYPGPVMDRPKPATATAIEDCELCYDSGLRDHPDGKTPGMFRCDHRGGITVIRGNIEGASPDRSTGPVLRDPDRIKAILEQFAGKVIK